VTRQAAQMPEEASEVVAARIRAGRWEGALYRPGATPPTAQLWLGGECVGPVEVQPGETPGVWRLFATIPADRLTDGIQTFLLREVANGETLAHFSILLGAAVDADLRAEVDLLRAELDILKAAVRRHLSGSGK
jgi:hypothetical protein